MSKPFHSELENNAQLYFIDPDGNWIPFSGAIDVSTIEDKPYDLPYSAEDLKDISNMEFTFTTCNRKQRGLYDVLLGRIWTKAAGRYIRWSKRNKEKQRRQKLKEMK